MADSPETQSPSQGIRHRLLGCLPAYIEKYALPRTAIKQSSAGVPLLMQIDRLRHANFLDTSFGAIAARPSWFRRVTGNARFRATDGTEVPELCTLNSSDALLMNVFAHPAVIATDAVAAVMGTGRLLEPDFGSPIQVPKLTKKHHSTIDMRMDGLLVEAKLTEENKREPHDIDNYRDYHRVFDTARLGGLPNSYIGFQLIRNVLAAHAEAGRFLVIHDAERPDLDSIWRQIQDAILSSELRDRCSALTWQQLATAVPADLRGFLAVKYGITSTPRPNARRN